MSEDKMRKILDLVRRTGDRVVVVDGEGPAKEAFVVMGIDKYEKILSSNKQEGRKIKGLTEEQLIDKINRDIALWKAEQEEEEEEKEQPEEENMYYYPEREEELPASLREEKEQEGEREKEKEQEDNIFEKFIREQQKYGEKEKDPKPERTAGGNEWKIPFDVKAEADEVEDL